MGHLSTVSRALDIKTSQVRKYIFKIQELNPRPLSGYTGGTDQYIVPDILMEKDGEELKIRLMMTGSVIIQSMIIMSK